jgi:hypothetical protein
LYYILVDKGDVTHFVANVVEDEEVNYTRLRQLLEKRETKSSSSNNILGNVNYFQCIILLFFLKKNFQ